MKHQWLDQDADGFGDNATGPQPDACPGVFGTSTVDRYGCVDGDGDGIPMRTMPSLQILIAQVTLMVMDSTISKTVACWMLEIRPSIDSDALIPMAMVTRMVMHNGQLSMVQMHSRTKLQHADQDGDLW